MSEPGKVFLVGAGPGAPDLLTLRGHALLRRADVVLYDFLVAPELLHCLRQKTRRICVGKADGLHLLPQGQINRLLLAEARAGKTVVRLKGGDVGLFSRGIEEALFLARHGVPCEIVPGVTSAFAAPMSFGIPLTRRGRLTSVAVLTGRKSSGAPLDAPDCDTLVYLMAVRTIDEVVATLLASGRKRSLPCAFIERGTTTEERIVTGTIGTIAAQARKHAVRAPAVLVVGEAVRYGRKVYGHKYPRA